MTQELIQAAAYFWDVPSDAVSFQDGRAISAANPELALSLRDLARRLHWSAGDLPPELQNACSIEGNFIADGMDYPNERDQVNSSAVYSFAADVVLVEIDKETLDIRLRNM